MTENLPSGESFTSIIYLISIENNFINDILYIGLLLLMSINLRITVLISFGKLLK